MTTPAVHLPAPSTDPAVLAQLRLSHQQRSKWAKLEASISRQLATHEQQIDAVEAQYARDGPPSLRRRTSALETLPSVPRAALSRASAASPSPAPSASPARATGAAGLRRTATTALSSAGRATTSALARAVAQADPLALRARHATMALHGMEFGEHDPAGAPEARPVTKGRRGPGDRDGDFGVRR